MVNDYIDYFRQLAISHKDIRHNESPQARPAQKKFTRVTVDEILKGLRTAVGFPCLVLELYQTDSGGDNATAVKLQPKGAFMIVDHARSDNFNHQQEIYAKTEKILLEIIQQIYQDHRPGTGACARPFKKFGFNNLYIQPVGPIFSGLEYGFRCEFEFELQNQIDITQPPAAGTFVEDGA